MPSSSLKTATVLSGLLLLLAACSPVAGNSLLTDQKTDPSALVLDKTPKSQELYMKAFATSINASGLTKAEVSGECYVSTYPTHAIVALKSGNPIAIVDVNPATPIGSNIASCKNGRFNFSINAGALAAGQHSIKVVLRAYEIPGGTPIVNDTQGTTNITLSK